MDYTENVKFRVAWGLVLCSAIFVSSAWADSMDVDKSKLLPSDVKQIDLFEQSLADYLKENPVATTLPIVGQVPRDVRVQLHVVMLGGQPSVMTTKEFSLPEALASQGQTVSGEKVVYSNSLYDLSNLFGLTFERPGVGVRISDDIGTDLVDACTLRRVTLAVNGGVPGGGGTFGALMGLYDGCPETSGVPVPGTFKIISGLDNNKAIIHIIEFVFPDRTCGGNTFNGTPCTVATETTDCAAGVICDDVPDIQVPPDFYLSLQFNRPDAGWLGGNPAEFGFSGDSFSTGLGGCNILLGSFPFYPHGSFYAVVSAQDTCETHFLAYQAVSNVAEAVEIGQGNRWAEDLTLALGDEACEISTLEIGFRGTGTLPYTVDVDIRELRDMHGLPGTIKTFMGTGGDKLEIARFRYDPGIFMPAQPWVTFSPSRDGVGILRPGDAQAGSSLDTFRIIIDDGQGNMVWSAPRCLNSSVIPESCTQTFPNPAIFYLRVKCRGGVPLGACCPPQNIPTVCEGGSTPGKACGSDEDCADGQCMLVDQSCATSHDCPTGSQCLSTCNGGIHDGLTCYTDSDCVSASAPSNTGTCVGAKICDKATCFDGVPVLGCPNGRWQALNDLATNRCADNPFDPPCGSHACCLPDDTVRDLRYEQCLRIEDPNAPPTVCGQCVISGATCFTSAECVTVGDTCLPHDEECLAGQSCQDNGICAPRTAIWHPGSFEGQDDFLCPIFVCNFGTHDCLEEELEVSCLSSCLSPVEPNCPNGTECINCVCTEGGGCNNPACCNLVCRHDNYCCDAIWDYSCVELAEELCPFIPLDNDECFCKTCNGVPFRCDVDSDCGLNADGSPRLCGLNTDQCEPNELIFTVTGSTNTCVQNSSSCRAFGEVDTSRASISTHDPVFCCNKLGPVNAVGSVWYQFTMPDVSGATSARFQTCNTTDSRGTDSIIQVYKATDNTNLETACGSLVTIGCNDDAGGTCGQLSDMCVDGLVPGETYYITLASPVSGVGGKYLLEVEVPCSLTDPPTSNDDCNDNNVIDVCDISNGEPDVDGNGVPDVCDCAQPQPASWTSIGQHGPGCVFNPACGGAEYGLDIPVDGSFSEPRSTGINKIIIAYDVPVDVGSAAVSVSGCDVNGNPQNLSRITMSVVAGANPNEAVLIVSPSLPGNNAAIGETAVKYEITISGVDCFIGGSSITDETRTAWAIFGDANSSPITVNNGDLGYVRSARDVILSRPPTCQLIGCNPPASLYEIRSDINNDNTVSTGDIGLVRIARDMVQQPRGLCP